MCTNIFYFFFFGENPHTKLYVLTIHRTTHENLREQLPDKKHVTDVDVTTIAFKLKWKIRKISFKGKAFSFTPKQEKTKLQPSRLCKWLCGEFL